MQQNIHSTNRTTHKTRFAENLRCIKKRRNEISIFTTHLINELLHVNGNRIRLAKALKRRAGNPIREGYRGCVKLNNVNDRYCGNVNPEWKRD